MKKTWNGGIDQKCNCFNWPQFNDPNWYLRLERYFFLTHFISKVHLWLSQLLSHNYKWILQNSPGFDNSTTDYGRPERKYLSLQAENSIPIPNFYIQPKHILSATLTSFSDIFNLCLYCVSVFREFNHYDCWEDILDLIKIRWLLEFG